MSFQPLVDLECRVHVELPVHTLLPWPEVGGYLRHGDYLGPVNLVGLPAGRADEELAPAWRPGTINIIVSVPVPLCDAAYVNAVMTATEAKAQAVLEAGFRATGTASDAICVAAPVAGEPADFAGPRSLWGARIARAVHSAVHTGAAG